MKISFKNLVVLLFTISIISCSSDDVDTTMTIDEFSPTSGAKQSEVTFTGTYFGTDSDEIKVFFNNKEATISSITETELKVEVPTKALTGTLTIEKDNTTIEAGTFTYEFTSATTSTFLSTSGTPYGIAIDGDDDIYFSTSANRIHKVTQEGANSYYIGDGYSGYTEGTGTAARIRSIYTLHATEDGTLYMPAYSDNKIAKVTPAGVMTTFAGTGTAGSTNGAIATATLNGPIACTLDSDDNLYVNDYLTHSIRKIADGTVSTLAGSGYNGNVNGTGTAASFYYPYNIEADSKGNLFVADYSNNCIRKITPEGVVTTFAGSTTRVSGSINGTGTAATFNGPLGLVIDKYDHIFVADYSNNLIREITPEGVVTTLAGSGSFNFTEGEGTAASFNRPRDLVIDSNEDLFVTDSNNYKIRKITRE